MRFDPEIRFHLPGGQEPVVPGSRLWAMPLSGKACHEKCAAEWTVGEYLTSAKDFLIQDQGRMVCQAVESLGGGHGPIQTLSIWLEKHGAFYHPLKIMATTGFGRASLVLNGAVHDPGRTLIETECRLLETLADRVTPACIPRVFGTGSLVTEKGVICFFLGEWFDNFHEFHVTRTAERYQVAVWKEDGTHELISWQQAVKIYEKVAYALTAYYELDTGHEIFPWHHAAGDFVVNPQGDVRLITVRGMGLLTETVSELSDAEAQRLFCLLFYFLNLTLCMRLDRLDGTGPMVWLPDMVIDAAVKGMFQSLKDREGKKAQTNISDGFSIRFLEFVKRFDPEQLHEIMTHLLEDRHFTAAEVQLIRDHLDSHCERIREILDRL
jgi:hypothetical protein